MVARVTGRVRPLIENPAPLAVACEMVRLLPPVLVKVSVFALLLPTVTEPKAMLDGFGASVPTPMPAPEMLRT